MQINNSGITNNTNANPKQKTVAEEGIDKPSRNDTTPASQDSVVLSNEAQSLKQLEAKIIDSTDVDTAKVNEIRQAIADGSYSIDADSIAQKILDFDS
ncbi:MAG: flagellar biosynthesis anti-sigma factor FlgM [Cellvibrionaceae bacterium]